MNKTVLVTGATRGIGLAIAKKLAKLDYQVLGIARHAPKETFPGQLFLADLTSPPETQQVLDKIACDYDIFAIINNVGDSSNQALGNIDHETFTRLMNLNVYSALQVTQAFVEQMKSKRNGRIINMASVAIYGLKNRSVYSATKSALVGLARTWALELAEYNITANVIAPGPIDTELFRKMRPPGSIPEQEILAKIPLNRLGQVDEIAAMAALLLSDEGGFITGQVISIDGGMSI